jgi:O-antigen/teichoic acid export membrane protein
MDEGRKEWVREYWPFLVGVVIIVAGNLYIQVVYGEDWVPGGPPLVLAVIVVLAIELGRSVYDRVA